MLLGTSAKQYIGFFQIKSVGRNYNLLDTGTLEEAIFNMVYDDLAHFNHDFKRIAGLSPSEFFKGLHPVDRLYLAVNQSGSLAG